MPYLLPGAPLARGRRARAGRRGGRERARARCSASSARRAESGRSTAPSGPPVATAEALASPPARRASVETAVVDARRRHRAGVARARPRRRRRELGAARRARAAFAEDPGALDEAYALHRAQSRRWRGHRPLPLELSRRLLAAARRGRRAAARACSRCATRAACSRRRCSLDHPREMLRVVERARASGRARARVRRCSLWSVAEWAAARGRARVNLGGSAGRASLAAFKRALGARDASVSRALARRAPRARGPARLAAALQRRCARRRPRGVGGVKIATLANAAVVHTRRWVEHFRARGHEVRAVVARAGPAGLGRARAAARRRCRASSATRSRCRALRRGLAAFAPDLVDAHFVPNYGLLGALAGRHPLSVTAWGSDLLVAGPRDALQRGARALRARARRLVLADSENLARRRARARRAAGARARDPLGHRSRRASAPAGAREPRLLAEHAHARADLRPADADRTASRPCSRASPQARLVIAGDGIAHARSSSALAAPAPAAGRVRFVGRLEPRELAELARRAPTSTLSASLSDSTSVSLLEAMAAGAVPVVSDIEGNREWVRRGRGRAAVPAGRCRAASRARVERGARRSRVARSARARATGA